MEGEVSNHDCADGAARIMDACGANAGRGGGWWVGRGGAVIAYEGGRGGR